MTARNRKTLSIPPWQSPTGRHIALCPGAGGAGPLLVPLGGSVIPVMKCSLSEQADGPRRCRRVSLRERSSSTRRLRRFQERSQRASSAASSWSQLSHTDGATGGSAGAARSREGIAARSSRDPAPEGVHSGATAHCCPSDLRWTAVAPRGCRCLSCSWGSGFTGRRGGWWFPLNVGGVPQGSARLPLDDVRG